MKFKKTVVTSLQGGLWYPHRETEELLKDE